MVALAPVPTVGPTDALVEGAKNLAAQKATELVMKYLTGWVASKASNVALQTFLSVVFLNPVASWLVGKVLWIAIVKTELGLFVLHVNEVTKQQGENYEEAQRRREAAQSQEERDRYEKITIAMARDLLKFNR